MVEERPGCCLNDHMLTLAPHIQPVECFDRTVRLAMRRTECCEIMQTDQQLRGVVHRVRIQFLNDLPRPIAFYRQRRAAVDDAIFIGAANAGKTRVPIIGHDLAVDDRNRRRPQMCVDRPHQAKGR